YLILAAETAAAQYANPEAIDFCTRALNLLAKDPAASIDTLSDLYRTRGRALEHRSEYEKALQNYEEMEAQGQARGSDALILASLMDRATIRLTANLLNDTVAGAALLERARPLAH